jgi:hypothetical protein
MLENNVILEQEALDDWLSLFLILTERSEILWAGIHGSKKFDALAGKV